MQLWRGQDIDVKEGKLLWSTMYSGYFCPLQSMSGVYKLEADLYPFQSFILLSFGVKNCLMQVTGISVLSRQVRFCSAWITAHYLSNTRLWHLLMEEIVYWWLQCVKDITRMFSVRIHSKIWRITCLPLWLAWPQFTEFQETFEILLQAQTIAVVLEILE